ncbi:conserved hypothetical protein [Neospora caninum Liverpool]|nr:conserved hypothetical protein [Neospora caninum Liverpool]CBZ51432.1 conserved hypothetical protein [Neospora caninum Liverpool]|eukprot:XP_003881465.1 conserved hypothetical protein [Neospora caninum Liverpool]
MEEREQPLGDQKGEHVDAELQKGEEEEREEKEEDTNEVSRQRVLLTERASCQDPVELFANDEAIQEQIRFLETAEPSLGPAAVAAQRRRSQLGEARRDAAGWKAEDAERQREDGGGASSPSLNSAGIVNMLLKHDKFVARPKLVFQNGEYRQEDRTEDELVADLQRLMRDSPHVVLERHGACFEEEHLRFFKEEFAASPEVQFYVKSLADKSSPGESEKMRANRRLAKMRQLVADGEFFSETAMQARQPALYHEFVGRYTAVPNPMRSSDSPGSSPESSSSSSSSSSPAACLSSRPFRAPQALVSSRLHAASSPGAAKHEEKTFFSADPRSLSSCLLNAMDNREMRRQAEEERGRWFLQDEELLAHIDGGRTLKTLQEGRPARRPHARREERGGRRGAQEAAESLSGVDLDEDEDSDDFESDWDSEEEEVGESVPRGCRGVAPVGGKRRRRFVDATAYAQKQQDFLLLMQEKFLAGHDARHIDYDAIDNDEALDDLQEMGRDLEEQYFCGEEDSSEERETRKPAHGDTAGDAASARLHFPTWTDA